MNLVRLRYFVAVAEELHFGRAADRLHMAQPPLSQQIRQLEQEVGSDLFTRTTRRVELTGAGRTLLPEARRLLAQADSVDRLMTEHREGEAGELRLGFVDSASYQVMPQFLRAHRRRHPNVTFELHSMSSEAQRTALLDGSIDIGIARTRGTEAGLDHRVILEERLFVAVSSDHRLADQSTTSLQQLRGESFVSFSRTQSPALTEELRRLLSDADVDYAPIIEAEEYTTIVGLVAAGEGVAIVPAAVRSFQPPNLAYVRLRDAGTTTRLMLLTRADERLRLVRHAIDLAETVFSS
ncbi:MAG: LysR substrate-binding domain-containing protein [Actinomycetota bacterium]